MMLVTIETPGNDAEHERLFDTITGIVYELYRDPKENPIRMRIYSIHNPVPPILEYTGTNAKLIWNDLLESGRNDVRI